MTHRVTKYTDAIDTPSRPSTATKLLVGGFCVGTALAATAWIRKEAQARMAEKRDQAFGEESMHDGAPRTIDGLPLNSNEEGAGTSRPLYAPPATHFRSEEEARWAEQPTTETASSDMPADDSLREHDFPVPKERISGIVPSITKDEDAPGPETIDAGGKPGKMKGDKQKFGETPTIMDQREATPDFAQQLG